ncbi:YhcH/YjgK/YiaL family protein [Bacillus sp. EB106-08-02-XG196]|uniref:YhcH/YjgK/YiaL family protein n=1 Tax=Bacillus sp. EB106-08-02-XG196 TaxID=2737049 RepID=UPI0015C4583A|nr:YhcH/YjgK/YiaL family protein [Bacillus sp. EB106-08-02-XG196]
MIFDRIENLAMYTFLNDHLNEAIKHILSKPLTESYTGDSFQKNTIQFTTTPVNEKKFEAHKKFIDIHIVLEGKEYVECVNNGSLIDMTEYDDEHDILFGDTNSTSKFSGSLEEGFALICFPEDAHLVGAHIDSVQEIKKVVFKVPI